MARSARRELPDGFAHVTCRTVRRFPLFKTARDAVALLDLLDHVTRDVVEWSVLAFCLMPNHLHLVVDARVAELSLAMHRVNGLYAQRFNRVHGYRGHLFQGRFHTRPIRDEAHLPGSIRYVLRNPVRAGLCAQPCNWRWSSYRACAALEPARPFLALERALSFFGPDPVAAREAFCRFVDDDDACSRVGTVPGTVPGPSVAPTQTGSASARMPWRARAADNRGTPSGRTP